MKIWMELKDNTDPERLLTLDELKSFLQKNRGQDVVFTGKAHKMDANHAPDFTAPYYFKYCPTKFWWMVELWAKECAEEARVMGAGEIGFYACAWKAVIHLLGAKEGEETACPVVWSEE